MAETTKERMEALERDFIQTKAACEEAENALLEEPAILVQRDDGGTIGHAVATENGPEIQVCSRFFLRRGEITGIPGPIFSALAAFGLGHGFGPEQPKPTQGETDLGRTKIALRRILDTPAAKAHTSGWDAAKAMKRIATEAFEALGLENDLESIMFGALFEISRNRPDDDHVGRAREALIKAGYPCKSPLDG